MKKTTIQDDKTAPVNPLYDWLWRPYGRMFNNLSMTNSKEGLREVSEITGEALMDVAAAAGAKVAIFDARNQSYAFHDSPFALKHPGLGSRDLVAEMIVAARKRGMVYVPYIPIDCDLNAWKEHPDWRRVEADGSPNPDIHMPRLCPSGPYRKYLVDYLCDLATRYEIGGFWFDGLGVPAECYCRYCRDGFRAATGLEAPASKTKSPKDWEIWLAYKHQETDKYLGEIIDAARAIHPGFPVCTAWEAGTSIASQNWIEANWAWPTAFLQLVRTDSGRPGEYYIPAFQYVPGLPLSLTTQALRDKAMTSIACGCMPTFTLTSPPDRLNTVTQELAERAEWLIDAEPVPYAGVVHSVRSEQLCYENNLQDDRVYAFYGAVKSLLEEKIPETCLSDRNLDHDDLARYKVIVLPDTGIIAPKTAERLRAYVENGGGLVAGFRTSLFDQKGIAQDDFSLADLLGVHFVGKMDRETQILPWGHNFIEGTDIPQSAKMKFLRLGQHPIVDDPVIRGSKMVEVIDAYRRGRPENFDLALPSEALASAKNLQLCDLYKPEDINPFDILRVRAEADTEAVVWEQEQTPGTRWPVMSVRRVGKGRVVYCAANLCFQYSSHWTWPFVRRLFTNAVRWAAGDNPPPFEVDGLLQVQATLFRQGKRLVLHLLNAPGPQGYPPNTIRWWEYYTPSGRQPEDIAPAIDTRVRLRGTFAKIYLAPGRQELPTTVANGFTEVVVPRLDTHLMVVAE
ncbi:MAG: beta-galactosidase trimerization domain-containing protein [Verrucomicrobiae bacterium]